ncbi:MAG: hypothetical protein ACOVNU_03145 [Candidatus Kapaibacteriota bacterium]
MNQPTKKLIQVDELLYFILFSHTEFERELKNNAKKQFECLNFNIFAKLLMVTTKVYTVKLKLLEINNLVMEIKKYEKTKQLEKNTELYKLLANINKLKTLIVPFKLASKIQIELEMSFKNYNLKLQTPLGTNYVKIHNLIEEINTIL